MKNIITTILITLLTYSLYAQVPGIGQVPFGMKYQAVARGADGQPMNSENIGLRFSILRDSENGTVIYTEERLVNTNDLGLFVVTIGSINLTDFSNIDWRLGDHFLQVEVQDNGNWIDLGTHQLLSVPYAMTAGNGKMKSTSNQGESLSVYGTNGARNVYIGGNGDNDIFNNGIIAVADEDGNTKAYMSSSHTTGAGGFTLRGDNGNSNVVMGAHDGTNVDYGALRVSGPEGNTSVSIVSNHNIGGGGSIYLHGENGTWNSVIGHNGNSNRGAMSIRSDDGSSRVVLVINDNDGGALAVRNNASINKAGFYINNDQEGNMWATGDKTFRMNHPKDPTKEIWYACIEGPESAAYERGSAELVNGETRVDFSEHFELVANPETMTFVLTPRSADSKGLAVVEHTPTGFIVKELWGGTGNYKFDWRVEGVRKGREDFQVIRDKAEMERMIGIDPTDGNTQK